MLTLDPIWQPDTQQRQFRRLLEAMSYPGQRYAFSHLEEGSNIALAVLSTLMDSEVTLADPDSLLTKDELLLLQIQPTHPDKADFILCDASKLPAFSPRLGTLASPEHSATLILLVDTLGQGSTQLKLTGPGIENQTDLYVEGLSLEWLQRRVDWNCSFPLGVDWILLDKTQITALPRTTQVEVM